MPLTVHGHVFDEGNVMFLGRINKEKALVVVFRNGQKAYLYRLGSAYDKRLCCTAAKLPSPGRWINTEIKPRFSWEAYG
jgi:hypothetical protein